VPDLTLLTPRLVQTDSPWVWSGLENLSSGTGGASALLAGNPITLTLANYGLTLANTSRVTGVSVGLSGFVSATTQATALLTYGPAVGYSREARAGTLNAQFQTWLGGQTDSWGIPPLYQWVNESPWFGVRLTISGSGLLVVNNVGLRIFYEQSPYLRGGRSSFRPKLGKTGSANDALPRVSSSQIRSEDINLLGDCLYNLEHHALTADTSDKLLRVAGLSTKP
jgi:hypothetical protein